MQTIAEVLKKIEDYSISNRAEFEALVKKNLAMQQTDQTKKQQKRIPQITTRLEQIDKVLNKLYEDNALGTIPQDRYEQTLGKETIDTFNTGESRGREVSHSLNYQKLGKDLATVDELAVLDGGKCILQLRGVRPFLSDKYDITKHPNYKYLSDADKRNEFDIERFLSRRLKPKPDEVYDVYDIDASVMDAGETAGG